MTQLERVHLRNRLKELEAAEREEAVLSLIDKGTGLFLRIDDGKGSWSVLPGGSTVQSLIKGPIAAAIRAYVDACLAKAAAPKQEDRS